MGSVICYNASAQYELNTFELTQKFVTLNSSPSSTSADRSIFSHSPIREAEKSRLDLPSLPVINVIIINYIIILFCFSMNFSFDSCNKLSHVDLVNFYWSNIRISLSVSSYTYSFDHILANMVTRKSQEKSKRTSY